LPRTTSARRYAQAAFEIAQERDELERWRSQLQEIAEAVKESPWTELLESRKVAFETKQAFLAQGFPETSPLVLNLVYLLVSRRRLNLLPRIVEEYRRLLDVHQGREQALVVTAVPLEERDKERLSQLLSRLSGRKVVLTARVDPAIVGGVVTRLGDKLIDGSVKSRLEQLRQRLARAA